MTRLIRSTATGRWSPTVTIPGIGVLALLGVSIVLVAAGLWSARLRHNQDHGRDTLSRLHQLSLSLNAVNAAEWQAVAAAPWSVSDGTVERRRSAAAIFVDALPATLPELPIIRERFATFSATLEAERQAIAERNIDGARNIDHWRVDPAFEELSDGIDQATAREERALETNVRRTDQLTELVLLAAAVLCGLLLWQWLLQRSRARVLGETAGALRRKEADLSEAQHVSQTGSWDWDLGTGRLTSSSELYRLLGREPNGPTLSLAEHLACYPPESASRFAAALEEVRTHRCSIPLELELPSFDGTPRWGLVRSEPAFDTEGAIVGLHGTIQDITERKEAETRLQRREAILSAVALAAERFLRTGAWRASIADVLAALGSAGGADRVVIFENATDPTGDTLITHRHEWCRAGLARRTGDPRLENIPLRASGFARWANLLGRGEIIAAHVRDLPAAEQPMLAAQGIRSVAVVPVLVGNEWWGFLGLDACTSERRWSLVELDALSAAARLLGEAIRRERDDESRARLESQLLNAQKMEALGQLAGGVAHDFNNLLTVILGNASRLDDVALGETERRRLGDAITNAANRAARLTAQLLALGRRQAMQRRHLDMNVAVMSGVDMLGRLLGEVIAVQTRFASDLPLVHADEGMVGQIIMNLAVNARDAMADGGTLTITTELVDVQAPAGPAATAAFDRQAVVLSMSDTGCGMDHLTRAHIFEPFFTTKPFGQGTGLGLSTVYGIVKQHDGWIEVQSELGRGTTFRVFLPVGVGPDERAATVELEKPAAGGRGTILLVEDEPEVREVTAALLQKGGYQVIEAGNGPEALDVWRNCRSRVDLLFTDMVMSPGMSGRDLAAVLHGERPDLKVIICSGYHQEPVDAASAPSANGGFLQKPFTSSGLLEAVRRQLSAAR